MTNATILSFTDLIFCIQLKIRGGINDKINHLSKQFNNVNVLENINLNIEDGFARHSLARMEQENQH